MAIDVSFDFRTDVAPGADPDASSATLVRYHHLLWSKPLPSGRLFELTRAIAGRSGSSTTRTSARST